jgi:TldD protein
MTGLELPPAMAAMRPELSSLLRPLEGRRLYGSLLLSSRRSLRIEIDNRVERVFRTPPKEGTVLSVFNGETVQERALVGFDPTAASKGLGEILEGIHDGDSSRGWNMGPGRSGDFATELQVDPLSLPLAEKLDRLRDLNRRVNSLGDEIVDVRLVYMEINEYSVFGDLNADLGQRVQRIYLILYPVVADSSGRRQYDYISRSGTFGWERLEFGQEELEALVESARGLLTAGRIEPGEYTVVASPSVAGVLCHESFGHGVETDLYLKGRARSADYLDQVVASPLVNINDDPSVPEAFGSHFFDDEGCLASPTRVVESGVFRRGITDLYSAARLGLERSSNGRRQDYSRKAYARMTNTFFARGETPVPDLFAQVDDGIYLEKADSGMEDPLGWGIQVTCRKGRRIRNGQLTDERYNPVGLSGYVPEVLQSIRAVGDEWQVYPGYCGKGEKETVPVSDGGPHLLMKVRLG